MSCYLYLNKKIKIFEKFKKKLMFENLPEETLSRYKHQSRIKFKAHIHKHTHSHRVGHIKVKL